MPILAEIAAQEREIRELEAAIATALVERDVAAVDRIWGEDFFYTGVRGETKGKAEILAELRGGELRFSAARFDEVRVRIYGVAALVTGLATIEGQTPQGPLHGRFRYTRVYAHREGRWQLVAFQGTPAGVAP